MQRLPQLELRYVGRILLAFAISLGAWYLVRVPYTNSLVQAASPILKSAIGIENQKVAKVDGKELVINTGVPSGRGPGRMVSLRNDGLYLIGWPALLLWTLIGVTPLTRLRGLWPWVLAAAIGLWATQALTLTLAVLEQVGTFRFESGLPFLGTNQHRGVVLSGEYLKVMAPVLPVAFFLPVFFLRVRSSSASGAEPSGSKPTIARNAPCPCGSGEKYKRCCGAA